MSSVFSEDLNTSDITQSKTLHLSRISHSFTLAMEENKVLL